MSNLILLSLVSLINDFSSKMILPILPFFIKSLGGEGLAIGIVVGARGRLAGFLKVLSGYWSDKVGKRKPFVLGGYTLSAISKFLFLLANSWPLVLVFRVLERTGKGLRSASRDAMISGDNGSHKSGRAFGLHRTFDSAGSILGTLAVVGLLYYFDASYKTIFLVAGIVAVFALIPLFFTKETGKKVDTKKTKITLSFRGLSPKLKIFLLAATLFSAGNISWMFFVLKSQTVLSGGEIIIPALLYALYHFTYTVFAYPSGMLADKFGKDKILFLGYFLFIPFVISFIYASSAWVFIILFLVYGLIYAFVESNERAYVGDLAPAHMKATVLGTFFTLTSLAALPAGILAGFLYDISSTYAFIYGAVLAGISIILFFSSVFLKRD